MNGEFTNYCKQYYELWLQWNALETRVDELLANALPYTRQTDVSELDAIIRCNRRIQKARANADECGDNLLSATETITKIFEYFEIQANTILTCEVPGFYELQLWIDDENAINCIKTRDLAPLEQDEDMITIPFTDSRNSWEDDEEEDCDLLQNKKAL